MSMGYIQFYLKIFKLLSGPGCPICVTPSSYIKSGINLTLNKNVILTSFYEVLKFKGENIKQVYSPFNALNIALENPNKEVVFLGIGFEPTASIAALALKKAKEMELKNFSVLSYFKTMPKALETVSKNNINGFICPGHVGTIIGNNIFNNIANKVKKPMVMCSFEALDILYGIEKILKMIYINETGCQNLYKTVVSESGNKKAQNLLNEVFVSNKSLWKGFGTLDNTGYNLSNNYEKYNAFNKFNITMDLEKENNNCICGEIIQGKKSPIDCKLFNTTCNLNNPIGPCMSSSEGACKIWSVSI